MDLVYRLDADLGKQIPIGLVPEGIRLDAPFSGTIVEGHFTGASLQGIDYLLLRADGVGVINAHEVITTPAGQSISVHAQGYITLPEGMPLPPPDVLLSPEFHWPDVALPLHGFALLRCGAPDLAWVNRTALAFTGSVNVGIGKLKVATYDLKLVPVGVPS